MPAFSAHFLFAKEMMDFLEKEADFPIDKNAVFIGSQGPDIFFFHRALPWQKGKTLRKAGSAMHRAKCGDIIDCFKRYCKNSQNKSIAQSYVYGFLLHYALDRVCHPYIYFIQERIISKFPKMNKNSVHNMIELSLDSVLLSKKEHAESPKAFRTDSTMNYTSEELKEVSRVIESAGSLFKEYKITALDAAQAIEDTRAAQRLLTDAGGKKEKFLKRAERLFFPFTGNFRISAFLRTDDLEKAIKYVNINNRIWKSPFSEELRSESFAQLFELAKADAVEMIKRLNNGLCGEAVTDNISFLTGVKVK